MPKTKKLTLLDRAKLDLGTAKIMLNQVAEDEAYIDICAYHCQQCVEKTAKYLITLQGASYSPDHRMEYYLLDLKDGEIKALIESVEVDIDRWATHARYRNSILASKHEVSTVINLCDKLIELAEKELPKPTLIENGGLTPVDTGGLNKNKHD